jgi:hypothetical protein
VVANRMASLSERGIESELKTPISTSRFDESSNPSSDPKGKGSITAE